MVTSWRGIPGVITASILTVLVGACGSSGENVDGSSSPTGGSSAAPDQGASVASLPEDVCTVLTAAELTAVVGAPVTLETDPSGGCEFSQEDPRALSGTVDLVGDAATNGGYDGYLSGLSGVLKDPVLTEIDGLGDAAAVNVGPSVMGSSLMAAGVVDRGSYLVTVTLVQSSGETAATLLEVAEKALRLLDEKVG